MKVSQKSKAHRTQLSLKNSVGFWKLHSRFSEFINTFYAYDSTCIQMFTFLNYFKSIHAFKRPQFRLIPNAFKRSQLNPELFSVIKTCPKSAPGFASILSRSLYRSHVLSTFFGPVLLAMMKQVCWHSRCSEAHRGLPEARPRTQNVMARGQLLS